MVGRQVLHLGLKAGVEEAHQKVRMLLLLNDLHPLFGSSFQLFETQTWSQPVGHPSDDVRRQQAEHSDFESFAFHNNIRSEVGLPCGFIDDIGS